MKDQHELVSALINMAAELGRTPTRDEFYAQVKGASWAVQKWYARQYNTLVLACGLDLSPNQVKKIKLTNEIFKKDIQQTLIDYLPKPYLRSKNYPEILIIGDLHFPFVHQKCLEAIYEFAKAHPEIKYIIQIGDIYDMFSGGKFPRSHNIYMPIEEERLARAMAEKMWKKLQEILPNATCIQILGNHDIRPIKRSLEVMPSAEHMIEYYLHNKLLTFNNVKTITDPRESYELCEIEFIHGYLGGIGRHRDSFLANVVHGHTHTGGVAYRQVKNKILWELDCGYVGDPMSKGLSYTPSKYVKWTLGWGFIDKHGPRFIPY